jgi:hypothetical protein
VSRLVIDASIAVKWATADERFLRKLGQARRRTLRGKAISLTQAAER